MNEKKYALNFVIPQGPTGPTGGQGIQGVTGPTGATGPAPTLEIGTVTTGAPGSEASVTISEVETTQ